MSSSVFDHYDRHLGPVYAWMTGDFASGVARNVAWFDDIGLHPASSAMAIDLGCGHGLHSVPLARRGFRVIGIDTCEILLQQLAANSTDLPIEMIRADLRELPQRVAASSAEVIVCMGDTLTHLPSIGDVKTLIEQIAGRLEPGGVFCTSFRDYASATLVGVERFIPVRSDKSRIQTCFLEYGRDVVHVHDLIYTKQDDTWKLTTGVYDKIRLDPAELIEIAIQNSLELIHESIVRGMGYYAFRRVGHGS